MKRWKVIISYKPDHMPDEEFEVNELFDVHSHVELGPDWRLIDAITITLNR